MKNILIVGGDGFIGWAAALNFLSKGYKVVIADNLIRRKIDNQLGTESITPIASIEDRVTSANDIFLGKCIFEFIDVAKEYSELVRVIKEYEIEAIIHLGELKSAPYSMINGDTARGTIDNNTNTTSNILNAIAFNNSDIHLVHMGTMGVYGYKDDFGVIPEGYLDVTVKSTGVDTSILFPTDPGSVYHMTKSLDQVMFQFYNKNWGIKITDLHQGIVWGTQTELTKINDKLINRVDYDGAFGSVLNRFIVESVIDYPLSVHGSGGQRRAFIHISDSVDCLYRAVENPPSNEKVRIFNQVSEVKSVSELANLIASKTGSNITHLDNPRKERDENNLYVTNQGLQNLGFTPTLIEDILVDDVLEVVKKYKHRINPKVIDSTWMKWNK